MAKKETEELSLHSIYLFRGDFAKLNELYDGDLTASKVVRTLVRRLLLSVQARKAAAATPLPLVEINLEDLDAGES